MATDSQPTGSATSRRPNRFDANKRLPLIVFLSIAVLLSTVGAIAVMSTTDDMLYSLLAAFAIPALLLFGRWSSIGRTAFDSIAVGLVVAIPCSFVGSIVGRIIYYGNPLH
jgi:predicted lysophospholipase L1 biosynthesis ABC-type transport system permease subunit